MNRDHLVVLAVLGALVAGCGASTSPPNDGAISPGPPWSHLQAIREGRDYLLRHLDDEGRFDYLRRRKIRDSKYNLLRHAGTIYALGQMRQHAPSADLERGIERASRYFQERYLRPVGDRPGLIAAVSLPEEESLEVPTAKLGGTGLALIALQTAYPKSSDAPIETMRGLGEFILFMQKQDGSFYSKYRIEGGFDQDFHSLYYPGEAMLGLVHLFAADPDPRWLDAAWGAAAQLIRERVDVADDELPADHWMMLAGAAMLQMPEAANRSPADREALRRHLVRLAGAILATQSSKGFFGTTRSTPTSTRIEGLTAVARLAPEVIDDDALERALLFLRSCQIRDDSPERGGMPRSCGPGEERRAGEVRIDYVQHYVSALHGYAQVVRDGTTTNDDRSWQ